MLFFTSILEEKNCKEEIKKLIMKYLNIHRVFNSIAAILKNYFLTNVPLDSLPPDFFPLKMEKNTNTQSSSLEFYLSNKDSTIDKNKENSKNNTMNNNDEKNNINNNLLREQIIFDHRLLNYYYQHYYSNKDFFISNEFQLANTFYKYIKLIAVLGKSEEIQAIIEEVDSTRMTTAIKKFEPNLTDIKKAKTKNFNVVDVKTQIKLSKSLRKIKTIKVENIKNKKKLSSKNRAYTIFEKNGAQVEAPKFRKKVNDNFLSTIYPKKNLVKRISLFKKEINNIDNNFTLENNNNQNSNNNLFKNLKNNNNDSSELVLGIEKKKKQCIN